MNYIATIHLHHARTRLYGRIWRVVHSFSSHIHHILTQPHGWLWRVVHVVSHIDHAMTQPCSPPQCGFILTSLWPALVDVPGAVRATCTPFHPTRYVILTGSPSQQAPSFPPAVNGVIYTNPIMYFCVILTTLVVTPRVIDVQPIPWCFPSPPLLPSPLPGALVAEAPDGGVGVIAGGVFT